MSLFAQDGPMRSVASLKAELSETERRYKVYRRKLLASIQATEAAEELTKMMQSGTVSGEETLPADELGESE